jgi:hypothetical protein
MKAEDRYLKFVEWSEPDAAYVGYCPDLFPWGGVCHASSEEAGYRELLKLVRSEVAALTQCRTELPEPRTHPVQAAIPA